VARKVVDVTHCAAIDHENVSEQCVTRQIQGKMKDEPLGMGEHGARESKTILDVFHNVKR
jgi:hypothetical protein